MVDYSEQGSRVYCFQHGDQLAHGCVIECPVCKHLEFLERSHPEAVADFKANWQTSRYNDPAPDHGCF